MQTTQPLRSDDTLGNGVCLLRGGCIAFAHRFDDCVTIMNPRTGAWMVLADDLHMPSSIVQAHDTSLIVAGRTQVFRITLAGELTIMCGHPESGFVDGVGKNARFSNVTSVTLTHDGSGVLLADDCGVRKVRWNGTVSTLVHERKRYGCINQVVACPDGSYVFDGMHKLCKVTEDGTVSTLLGDGVRVDRRVFADIDDEPVIRSSSSIDVSSNGILVYKECWGWGTIRLVDLKTGGVKTLQYNLPEFAQSNVEKLESLESDDVTSMVINKQGNLLVNVLGVESCECILHEIKLDNIPNIGGSFTTFKGWGAPWLKPNRACIRMCSPKVKDFMVAVLLVAARAKLRSLASAGRRSTRATVHWESRVLPLELWHHIIAMVLPPPCSALP